MKKAISLVLLIVMVLSCVGFAACVGGGVIPPGGGTTPPPSDGGTTPTPTPTPTGGGFTRNDMPVYPGCGQAGKMAWAIPPEEGEWQRVEWRWYETGDSQSKVVAFYQSEMPKNGWQQTMTMEMGELSWFMYTKNNEQDGAMVWIGAEDGKTTIGLMRGGE